MCRIVATNGGNQSTNATSHTINLPSGIVNGSRVTVRVVSFGASHTTTFPAGWTTYNSGTYSAGNGNYTEAYRDCDGTEPATITVTTSVAVISAHSTFRFTGHHAQAPEGVYADGGILGDPDPPSLSPTWGQTFSHWHVGVVHRDDGLSPSEFPTTFNDLYLDSAGETRDDHSVGIGNFGCNVTSAELKQVAGTIDPDAFALPQVFAGSFLTAMRSTESPPAPPEEPPTDPGDHFNEVVIMNLREQIGPNLPESGEATMAHRGSVRGSDASRLIWGDSAGSGHRRTTVDAGKDPDYPAGARASASAGVGHGGWSPRPIWPVWQRWSLLNGSAGRLSRMRYTFSVGVQGYEITGNPATYGPLGVGIRNNPLNIGTGSTTAGWELYVPGGVSERNWQVRYRRYPGAALPAYADTETGISSDEPHRVTWVYTEGEVPTMELYIDNDLIETWSGEKQMPTLPTTISEAAWGPSLDGKIYSWDARILIEELTPAFE